MKVAVWKNSSTLEIVFTDPSKLEKFYYGEPLLLLGYAEFPIEKPKKTVVKEAHFIGTNGEDGRFSYRIFSFPSNAKNIKPPTYEE